MDETHRNNVNSLFDLLIKRLEHDIKEAPPEYLEEVVNSVLMVYRLKQVSASEEQGLSAQEKLLKEITKMMKNKNNGQDGVL